jgi:hypothetical protein
MFTKFTYSEDRWAAYNYVDAVLPLIQKLNYINLDDTSALLFSINNSTFWRFDPYVISWMKKQEQPVIAKYLQKRCLKLMKSIHEYLSEYYTSFFIQDMISTNSDFMGNWELTKIDLDYLKQAVVIIKKMLYEILTAENLVEFPDYYQFLESGVYRFKIQRDRCLDPATITLDLKDDKMRLNKTNQGILTPFITELRAIFQYCDTINATPTPIQNQRKIKLLAKFFEIMFFTYPVVLRYVTDSIAGDPTTREVCDQPKWSNPNIKTCSLENLIGSSYSDNEQLKQESNLDLHSWDHVTNKQLNKYLRFRDKLWMSQIRQEQTEQDAQQAKQSQSDNAILPSYLATELPNWRQEPF